MLTTVDRGSPQGLAPRWHALSPEETMARLGTRPEGLTPAEAEERLAARGPNVIERGRRGSSLKVLWRQIDEPLIWVLIGAAILAIALGKVDDGVVVAAVVVLNTLVGFVQESRAGRAIEALSDMVPEYVLAVRAGQPVRLPVADLVPGDIIRLAAGDKGPADVRLIHAASLQVDEATLTGESVPAVKTLAAVPDDAVLGDRTCIVFGGTLVATGSGQGVVVATGADSELGRMSAMLDDVVELETPLTRALGRIGKILTLGVLALSAVMLVVGTVRATSRGIPLAEALADAAVFAISLAVGAIPEGLPAIVTIGLAVGVRRMASRRAIVRSLPSIETLGSTTVICTDKTGTLTRNEMTVRRLVTRTHELAVHGVGYEPEGAITTPSGDPAVPLPDDVATLLRGGIWCNDATLTQRDGRWAIDGDPTEGALLVAAAKAGFDARAVTASTPRLHEIPFDSDLQAMAVVVAGSEVATMVVKGAPEVVAAMSERWLDGTPLDRAALEADVSRLGAEGLRVLAVASRPWPERDEAPDPADMRDLSLVGLVAMIDPPRPEAIEAVEACHDAGIRVVMITGDHRTTAAAIGRQLGLHGDAVTGAELAAMDDDELDRAAVSTDVFARVAPEHKLRLVQALQRRGDVAAMTGDGTNDAPALRQADIGVAMGITGTSVAKGAADVVLVDDNFATIRAAVEEGRRVYDNLVKALAFVLPTNLGLALILMFAVAFFPFDQVTGDLLLPVLPTQLLWINLVASVTLAIPLAFEVAEPDVMRRPPRPAGASPLSRFVIVRTATVAVLMAAGAIALSWWEYRTQLAAGFSHDVAIADAQTMAVTTVIAFQVFYLLLSRTLRGGAGAGSNPVVFLGIAAVIVLQLAFVYAPPLQAVFDTAPITPAQFGLAVLVGMTVIPVIWIEKRIRARRAVQAAS